MTIDAETLHEVVRKLCGPIDPVGETNADDGRFKNLKTLCTLVNALVVDIDRVGMERNAHEFSVKRAGQFASDFMTKDLGISDEAVAP